MKVVKQRDPCHLLRQIVRVVDRPVLLVAGPGTGKTTAIACRLKSLIEDKSADPDRILGVTFTNEAAREMQSKIEKMGIAKTPQNIRTLHSFAMQVLTLHLQRFSIKRDCVVANLDECALVAREAFADLKSGAYQLVPRGAKKYMRAFQQKCSCGLPPSGLFSGGIPTDGQNFSRFGERYKEVMRFYNALDWFEVVPLANALLADDSIRQRVNRLFDHIAVDEYQDLNPAEQKFVELIRRDTATLFVVGDDDQSVYESGRFADPSGMKNFKARYPDALIDKGSLRVSYRCRENILKAALSLIKNNEPHRLPKRLTAKRPGGLVCKKGDLGSKQQEAKWIAKQINWLHSKGIPYNGILVLFNVAHIGNYYVTVVKECNIPVNDELRKPEGLDSLQKQKLYFILRLVLNSNDGLALRQLLALEQGLTLTAITRLRRYAEGSSINLRRALHRAVAEREVQQDFKRWLESLKAVKVYLDAVKEIALVSDFGQQVAAVADLLNCQDLEFVTVLKRIVASEGKLEPWEILEEFRRGKLSELRPTKEEGSNNGGVRFMTMHNAKGIDDADAVFIPALEADVIPAHFPEQEQRRTLYVAMTRAREALFLSCAWSRRGRERYKAGGGQVIGRRPSKFWDEIQVG